MREARDRVCIVGHRKAGSGGEHHGWAVFPHPTPLECLFIGGAPHDERTDADDERIAVEVFQRVLPQEVNRTIRPGYVSVKRDGEAGNNI